MTQALLIRNARCSTTFDASAPALAQELRDASLLVQGNRIMGIGPANDVLQSVELAPLVARHKTLAQVLTA